MDALPPPAYVAPAPVCKRWSWSSDRKQVWCLTWVTKDNK
jgi:hypothetical protein